MALCVENPSARTHLRHLFESIARLSGQQVMWNYFHQRRDYLEDHRLGYKPDEPLGPHFHPMVAATMHIGASDILPESLPPDPPSCMTLIPPSVQACLEALHIVQSASGDDLRAAAQMCSPPVRVHFHQSSKSINFQYQAWAPTDVPGYQDSMCNTLCYKVLQICNRRTLVNPSRRSGASDVKLCITQYTYGAEP